MTTLVMIAFVLFGIFGYTTLPVSELPRVDFPTIAVTATLPGADPETVASAVATPLESQFSSIPGVASMSSASSQGTTRITLQFDLDRNIDAAAQDVQAAISAAQPRLPRDMPSPPVMRKVNPSDAPILFITITSNTVPLAELNEYAEGMIARRLSSVSGVAQVSLYGPKKYAVRLQIDPKALAARGIGIDEVRAAAAAANVNLPTGVLNSATRTTIIRAQGQLTSAEQFSQQIVAYRDGAPVRFRDIGVVVDSVENDKQTSFFQGERSITLAVQRQPDANTIEVADAVRAVLPRFEAMLPAAAKLTIVFDRSESIRASVHDVQFTLILAAALVVMVIFLFLRTLSATIIPSLALPIAIIGTFAGMAYLGYSLNNLTLMALTLSVGFVVDDAIVMLENIMRHVEKGEDPYEASLNGAKEISFTILSMTVSLAAVFIPILFMGGIVGRLLHEFAVTIVLAIIVSGIVSITLTPMLCSRMIRRRDPSKPKRELRILRWSERAFDALQGAYGRTLRIAMRHHRVVFMLFLASIGMTYLLFTLIPKDFLPASDTGQIFATTEGPPGTSFAEIDRQHQILVAIAEQNPNVYGVVSVAGGSMARSSQNSGMLMIRLKPYADRNASAEEIIQQLRPQFAQVPGVRVYMSNPPPIRIGGMASKAQYQYTLQDLDVKTLYEWSGKLMNALDKTPGFMDVTSDLDLSAPTIGITINRDRAAALGLTPQQIETALASSFGGIEISTIYTSANQYPVILELKKEYQEDESAMDLLHLRSSSGTLVPLRSVVSVSHTSTSLVENHLGQLPAVTITFNLAPGVALSGAMERIAQVQQDINFPDSIQTSFQGTAQAFQSSMSGMGMLLALAILVVYIVLGILYESFIHPLTILSGLPAAAVGALLTLLIFQVPLTLYAFVGIIMLVGIVKKNAIIMIDFALERERKEGLNPAEAIVEAAIIRFRPIMMTTSAAFMGIMPIAFGYGEGGETRQPLGLTVMGGLLLSQVLTLYITPVLYVYLDRLARHFTHKQPVGALAPGE